MPRKVAHLQLQRLAKEYTEQAVVTLAKIMLQPKSPDHARIAAANSLLNRGWGLPTAHVEVEHSSQVLEELKEWLSWRKMPEIIEGDTRSLSPNANDTNRLAIADMRDPLAEANAD